MTQSFEINSNQIDKIKEITKEEKKFRIKNLELFKAAGFPNKRLEDWKFSDFRDIVNRNFDELRKVIESRDTRKQVKTSTDNLAKSRTGFIKSATKFLLSSNKSEENRYTYYGRT